MTGDIIQVMEKLRHSLLAAVFHNRDRGRFFVEYQTDNTPNEETLSRR